MSEPKEESPFAAHDDIAFARDKEDARSAITLLRYFINNGVIVKQDKDYFVKSLDGRRTVRIRMSTNEHRLLTDLFADTEPYTHVTTVIEEQNKRRDTSQDPVDL